jgi:hypothetical protein
MIFKGKDIFDINFELCSKELGLLNLPKDNLPQKGILLRILVLFRSIAKKQFAGKGRTENRIKENANIFFSLSRNEFESIKSIANGLDGAYIIGDDQYQNGFPLKEIYLKSLLYIPRVFLAYLKCSDPYYKKSFLYAFDNFCLACAAITILPGYSKNLNAKQLVVANHTFFLHRIFISAAIGCGIKTTYIQHASVTEKFPPLTGISQAFLEGEDSLHKYQGNGSSGIDMYLIGMPKFDAHFRQNALQKDKITRVGICTNGLDSIDLFGAMLKELTRNFKTIRFILRPHPADKRISSWLEIAHGNAIEFSEAKKITSFDFLEQIDVLIAGDSNIHIEATLNNIPCIYFYSEENCLDWYGFLKQKMVFGARNTNEVIQLMMSFEKELPSVRQKAKHFVSTVGSVYEADSTGLAVNVLENRDVVNTIFNTKRDHLDNHIYYLK